MLFLQPKFWVSSIERNPTKLWLVEILAINKAGTPPPIEVSAFSDFIFQYYKTVATLLHFM
jgi:hypothetical protein